ncbi:nucleotidyltransferase [Actibacterium mucosum KCTC 23349]|uniref:Nucleotidyltransferase n=1 Tax=Actibacterium mucosum KCTC 23349 TaxID=1454373 RepID=A0A037ZNJ2_9RHOB|nr:nucleotidyltransferase family protein [Actibacterium mucosum]KAJ57225.1 nucleotidyltransferase [Actibacterium mucosum KCTC 23349]
MPFKPNTVMIFAAGFGTRMGQLTKSRPKPLIHVAGTPLLDHALDTAFSAGIETVLVNTHYLADQIALHLAGRDGVLVQHEADQILETGGGLKRAAPRLGPGPVATLNCDAVWHGTNPLDVLSGAWQPERMKALLLLKHRDLIPGYGGKNDFGIDGDGRIYRGGPYIYLGAQIMVLQPVIAHSETVFSFNVIWDQLIESGQAFGVSYPGNWCDVGSPEGILRAEEMLRV